MSSSFEIAHAAEKSAKDVGAERLGIVARPALSDSDMPHERGESCQPQGISRGSQYGLSDRQNPPEKASFVYPGQDMVVRAWIEERFTSESVPIAAYLRAAGAARELEPALTMPELSVVPRLAKDASDRLNRAQAKP